MTEISTLEVRPGRRLAYRLRRGRGPTLLFLPGYMSDMEGSKATALDAWAGAQGRAMLRFDYGGCGASEGEFEAQGLDDWRADTLAMIDSVAPEGRLVLVGSSMGGWLMLLAALARPERIAALVGIAAAPDFTDWGYDEAERRTLAEAGRLEQSSPYGEAPFVTTRAFWESGQRNLLLGREIGIDRPVRLLHGQEDRDVPWRNALRLGERLRSADVQTLLIKDGDHRLSRPQDIALLIAAVHALMEQA
jgi:pimeloyl-ACP methyl ester carboxylesterase